MKRIVIFAALAVSMLALPAASSADTDCSASTVNLGTVGVTAGSGGESGSADLAAGACVDLGDQDDGSPADSVDFFGGLAEVGVGLNDGVVRPPVGGPVGGLPGVYAVVDGDDQNLAVSDQGGGYIGASNFEDGAYEAACDQSDSTGSGTNAGGCFAIRDLVAVPGAPLACGNSTGKSWDDSRRDGCTIP